MKKPSPISALLASPSGGAPGLARLPFGWLLATAVLLAPSSVRGAADAWTSTASNAWGTAGNWSGGVPTGTSNLTFTDNLAIQHALSLGGNRVAADLTFANGTGGSAFVFDTAGSANVLTLSGAGITNNATQTQIFNNQIAVTGNQTWNAAAGGLRADGVTLTANLTLSGANAQTLGINGGALVNSSGNRTLTNNSTGTVGLGAINLSNDNTGRTLTINGGGSATVTGIVANGGTGAGNLAYSGTGTLSLSGANTYTGTTSVGAGGILALKSNGALGTATNTASTTVASGGVLQMSNNITTTNAGTLILNGAGTGMGALQNLSGNNTWDSGITLASNATIYSATAGNTLFINANYVSARTLTLGANTLTIDGPGDTWINSNVGVAGDTGGVIKNGSGKATYYGYNTFYTGATVVNAGSLDLIVGPFTSGWYGINGSLTIGTGPASSALAGTVAVNIVNNSYTNQISPTSAVTINSDGLLYVGTSTGVGALTLNGGQVSLNTTAVITPTSITSNANSAGQMSSISGGQISLGGAMTITAARDATLTTDLSIGSAIAAAGNVLSVGGAGNIRFNGALTGTAGSSLTKTGAGTLTLGAANPSFLGSIAVNGGTLQTNVAGAITGSNTVSIAAGATLATNGFNQTVGAFTNNGTLNLGAGSSLTLTAISALNGLLSGNGTIILNAGSILTLGANFNNSAVNFQLNGGTLNLNGTTGIFGSLTVSANSIIDFSGGAVADFASVSFPGTSILTVNNWTNGLSYFYSNTSIGAQGSAPANQIVFSGNSGNLTRWNAYTDGPGNFHQVTPVPEPSTYGAIFVGLSLLGTFLVRARRKKRAGV